MIGEDSAISSRARVLREAFDHSFASIPHSNDEGFEGILAIRIAGEPYAIALDEVHGLFVDRKVVPLPGRFSQSMGITCLRTGIVAVYSLGAFLGCPDTERPMRWLILVGQGHPYALAFERFDAYARIPRSQFLTMTSGRRAGHIHGTAMIAGERRSIVSLRSITQSISNPS